MPVWRITNGHKGYKAQHVQESLADSICGMRVHNVEIANREYNAIRQDVDVANPGRLPRVITGWTNQLINLRDTIQQDEFVLMNNYNSNGFYIGVVADNNYVNAPDTHINHRRNVNWSELMSYNLIDEILTRKIKQTPASVTKVNYDNIEATLQELLNQ